MIIGRTKPARRFRCTAAAFLPALVALPAVADTIYVDFDAHGSGDGTSWVDAYPDLRAALLAAQSGDQLWVAQGKYSPSGGDRTLSFELRSGIAVYGGFAGTETQLTQRNPVLRVTTLTGDLYRNDNGSLYIFDKSLHVVRAENVDQSARLDGFTIADGIAQGPGNNDYAGGGIFIVASSPVIANCVLTRNRVIQVSNPPDSGGGAVYCGHAAPTFSNCYFTANQASGFGGAVFCIGIDDAPSFVDCTFEDNRTTLVRDRNATFSRGGDGGAISCVLGSAPRFLSCVFRNNATGDGELGFEPGRGGDGGAVHGIGSSLEFTNCAFIQNRAGDGGLGTSHSQGGHGGGGGAVYVNSGTLVLAGSLFAENQAGAGGGSEDGSPGDPGDGGAILCGATAQIVNATIVANSSLNTVGGISIINSRTANIDNSVLWDNSGSGGVNLSAQLSGFATGSTLDYSCVLGYTAALGGVGNTNADPLFAAPASGDYRIAAGSPCIDAAANSALPSGYTVDLDGNPRFIDDCGTTDTGVGPGAIVDMGAYEFASATPPPGDLNLDYDIDIADLAQLLAHFSMTGATYWDGDIDGNGAVDLADLSFLLSRFGRPCGP